MLEEPDEFEELEEPAEFVVPGGLPPGLDGGLVLQYSIRSLDEQ